MTEVLKDQGMAERPIGDLRQKDRWQPPNPPSRTQNVEMQTKCVLSNEKRNEQGEKGESRSQECAGAKVIGQLETTTDFDVGGLHVQTHVVQLEKVFRNANATCLLFCAQFVLRTYHPFH